MSPHPSVCRSVGLFVCHNFKFHLTVIQFSYLNEEKQSFERKILPRFVIQMNSPFEKKYDFRKLDDNSR